MVDICMPQASTFDICTFQDSPAARVSITRSSHEMAHLHPSRHPPTVPISLRSVSTCCQLPGVDLRSGVAMPSSNKAFCLPSTRPQTERTPAFPRSSEDKASRPVRPVSHQSVSTGRCDTLLSSTSWRISIRRANVEQCRGQSLVLSICLWGSGFLLFRWVQV